MAQYEYEGDYDYEAENRRQQEDAARNAAEQANGGKPVQQNVQGQFGSYSPFSAITDLGAGDPEYNRRQGIFEGETNWGAIEAALRQEASNRGLQYDPSDLEGIRRNAGYDASHQGAGGGYASKISEFYNNALQNYDQRANNTPGGAQPAGGGSGQRSGGGGGGGNSVTNAWQQYVGGRGGLDSGRGQDLWRMFMDRANQGLNISREDPVIRQASDAYSANEQRAGRDFISDLAEKSGPYANLRGEERLAAERIGQRTGTFETEMMVRELEARRTEIQNALTGLSGLWNADETRALQEQLGLIDAQLRQQGIDLQGRALDQDWSRAMLQNDQFMANLGLQANDRSTYYDLIRRGLL